MFPKISLEEVARRADWHNVYLTAYAVLSGAVHTSAADLEAHLDYDHSEQRVVGFCYGPTDSETLRTVGLAGMTMTEALGDISADFSEDRRTLCAEFKKTFEGVLPHSAE